MFAALLPEDKKLMVSSVQRPGEAVTIKACKNDAEYYKELNDKIKEFEKNDGLTAIICKKQSTIEKRHLSLYLVTTLFQRKARLS